MFHESAMVATLRYGGYIIPLPVLPDRGRGAAIPADPW